jgi:alpha-ketoglutarate-dependent taurine dioxygenase
VTTVTSSALRWRACRPGLGAEIFDCDLAALVDAGADADSPVAAAVREAWRRHRLVLFRGQTLDAAQQEAVASWFGPLERSTPQRAQRGEEMASPVHWISNRVAGGQAGDGELVFHSDSATRRHPIRAVALFAEAVPTAGGHTVFADAVAAWRTLPASLRGQVEHLEAVHAFDYEAEAKPLRRDFQGFSARHPVVMAHPLSGEPVLYVNRGQTWYLDGLDDEASADLLERLWAHVEDPRCGYEHRWRVGDLVVWDNVALQHARTAFDPAEARTLRRVVVSGAPDGDRAFVA